MNLLDILQERKSAVEAYLDKILPDGPGKLAEAMRYAVLSGGKRFRPLLTLSAGACCGADEKDLMPWAVAVELVHNYSLVHDDLPCLDNDEYRRGRKTCHKAYGEDMALLAGDALLTLAFEIMARAAEQTPSGRGARAVGVLAESAGRKGMLGGQYLDITLKESTLNEESLIEVMRGKTGALITAAVSIGGIMAGASEEVISLLEEYGKNLGQAFQIRDDILDADQDSAHNGGFKPNAANFLGREEAVLRLEGHIQCALDAVDKAVPACGDLRFLANRLLDLGETGKK